MEVPGHASPHWDHMFASWVGTVGADVLVPSGVGAAVGARVASGVVGASPGRHCLQANQKLNIGGPHKQPIWQSVFPCLAGSAAAWFAEADTQQQTGRAVTQPPSTSSND
jgi:hypothetical protein